MSIKTFYLLRIWLDPAKMKAYGLVPKDIDDVLAAQNLESATDSLGRGRAARSSMCCAIAGATTAWPTTKTLCHGVAEGERLLAQIVLLAQIAHDAVGQLPLVFYNK